MKKYVVIAVLLGCFLPEIYGFPGAKRDFESREDDGKKGLDTLLILPSQHRPDRLDLPDLSFFGDDEDSDGFFDTSYPIRFNPFGGLLESMQNAMNRLRAQMAGVLNHMPGQGSFTPWFKIPEGANTTSTTKVIDGHVVTINETTYSDGDDIYGTVLRVSVIDVKPQNETVVAPDDNDSSAEVDVAPTSEPNTEKPDSEENTTASRSVETVEDFSNNEIPKNQADPLTA